MRPIFLVLLTWCSLSAVSAQMRYVVETAQPGDGALALLGRYRLDRDPCNLEEFYRINKIKKNQGLQVDVQYKLPIRIFTFNQKSIMGTVGIQDEATALRIDDYNHKMYIRGIKPGRYQSDRQLWVPHGLLHCKPTVLKAPAQREYAFLGKKHQKIVLKDNQLAGAVYYLIPGHGGPDPGAVGKVGKNILCEDEYAYDVTLRLAKTLLEHGAVVYLMVQDPNDGIRDVEYLSCDSDEKLMGGKKIPVNQKSRLQQRTDLVNALFEKHRKEGATYQRLLEIHVDSRAKHERIDLFFYYAPGSIVGRAAAKAMYEVMSDRYRENRKNGQYEGAVIPRDLFTLTNSLPPSIFVELGNIQNRYDQKRLTVVANRQLIADWLAEGLMLDY
jgi:N-acetylmuramoyl-L-alanine amidase